MTQRAVVFETEDGHRSVVDILEWPEDRLDLNKRRLRRHMQNHFSGAFDIIIEQVDGPTTGTIYSRSITV